MPSSHASHAVKIRNAVNYWVLLLSIVVLGGLGAGAYFWHKMQLDRIADVFLERASEFEKEDKWYDAASYTERYLKLHPQNTQAKILLAKRFDKWATNPESKNRAAELYYIAMGVASKEESVDLRRRVMELLLSMGRFADLERESQSLLENVRNDPSALRFMALAKYGNFKTGVKLSRRNEVGEALELALAANPADIELSAAFAEVLREDQSLLSDQRRSELPTQADRDAIADSIINEMIAKNSTSAAAYRARFFYRSHFKLTGRSDDLDAMVQHGMQDTNVLLFAGTQYLSESEILRESKRDEDRKNRDRLLAESLRIFNHVLEKVDPKNVIAYVGLGDVHVLRNELPEAIAVWKKGLEVIGQGNWDLSLRITEKLIATNQLAEAKSMMPRLAQGVDDGIGDARRTRAAQVDLIRTQLSLRQNQPVSAATLAKAVSANGNLPIHLQLSGLQSLAAALSATNDVDQAAEAFEKAAEMNSANLDLRVAAGRACLAAGFPDRAIRNFEIARVREDSAMINLELGVANLAYQLRLPIDQRNWNTVESILQKLESKDFAAEMVEPWRVPVLRADMLISSHRGGILSDEAKQAIESVLAKAESLSGDSPAALRTIIQKYEVTGNRDRSDQLLAKATAKESDLFLSASTTAWVHVSRKQFDKAKQVLEESYPKLSAVSQARARLLVAQIAIAEGNFNLATGMLEKLYEQDSNNILIVRMLAELEADGVLSDHDVATGNRAAQSNTPKWESKLQSLEPAGAVWRFIRARRLLRTSKGTDSDPFKEAVALQAEIQRSRPTYHGAFLLKGLIAERMKRSEEAIEAYKSAIQLGNRSAFIYQLLIGQLNSAGRFVEANEYISRLDTVSHSSEQFSPLAMVAAAGAKNFDRAVALGEAEVKARPMDPKAWLRNGHVLNLAKKHVLAEKSFRKALELAPDDLICWNGLFGFFVSTERPDEARTVLEQMSSNAKISEDERAFFLAQCHAAIGDNLLAETQYKAAAQKAPSNINVHLQMANFYLARNNRGAAQESLELVHRLAKEQNVRGGAVDSARRTLASLLAIRGTEEDLKSALGLLREGAQDVTSDQYDARLEALMLSSRPDATVDQIARAQQLLEDLVFTKKSGVDADSLVLASIYSKQIDALTGEPRQLKIKAARERYEAVVLRQNPNPTHVGLYANFLMKLEEWGAADEIIRVLEESSVNDVGGVYLRAKWLQQQGRKSEIEKAVAGFAARHESKLESDEARSNLFLALGGILNSFGFTTPVEMWYRKAYQNHPGHYEPLVRHLAVNGKTAEAVDLCLESGRADDSRGAALLASVLVNGQADARLINRVEPVLVQAASKFVDNADLLLSLANLRVLQSRTKEASTLYARVLSLNPKSVVALNNLATILGEEQGGSKEALNYVDEAIRLIGPMSELLDTKGMIVLHAGRASEAVELLQQATKAANVDPRHHFHLAVAYLRTGNKPLARDSFNRAVNHEFKKQLLTKADMALLDELQQSLAGN